MLVKQHNRPLWINADHIVSIRPLATQVKGAEQCYVEFVHGGHEQIDGTHEELVNKVDAELAKIRRLI